MANSVEERGGMSFDKAEEGGLVESVKKGGEEYGLENLSLSTCLRSSCYLIGSKLRRNLCLNCD